MKVVTVITYDRTGTNFEVWYSLILGQFLSFVDYLFTWGEHENYTAMVLYLLVFVVYTCEK